jgi:hypothetical protein
VILNLGRRDLAATLRLDGSAGWQPVLGTHGSDPPGIARNGRIKLRALEGVVLVGRDVPPVR